MRLVGAGRKDSKKCAHLDRLLRGLALGLHSFNHETVDGGLISHADVSLAEDEAGHTGGLGRQLDAGDVDLGLDGRPRL